MDGLLVILSPTSASHRLAAADWEISKRRQPELLELEDSALERKIAETEQATRSRVRRLRQVHASAIALVLSAAAIPIGWRVVWDSPSSLVKSICALASVCVFAWATLARLGWAGQSIRGDTAPERIDEA